MVRCEGEQSSCCCKSYNARFTSFGLNQLSMFDVWPEHRRGLASVKSALIALICMEMDIDWWGQTQVCHWKHFSCTPYSVLSGKMTIDKVKNMILKLKPHNKARTYSVHDFQQLNKKGKRKVRTSKPDTLSNCFIWSRGNVIPAVHTLKHTAQDLRWAEWKITHVRALAHSRVVQNSQPGFTSKASVWSPSLQT